MAALTEIADRLDAPLSTFWPTYEDSSAPVRRGDRAVGTTFDHNGRDRQHEGMVVDVTMTFTNVFRSVFVTIEDDEGNDWECDPEVIELVRERDASWA